MKLLSRSLYSLLAISLIFMSCGGDESTDPTPVNNTTYNIELLGNDLGAPNRVNAIIQVSDQNNTPVSALIPAEITINEDGEDLNAVLDDFMFAEGSEITFSPFVAVLIDNNSASESDLDDLKAAASDLMDFLPSNSRVNLYTYDENVRTELEFENDLTAVKTAIADIEVGNEGSNVFDGIDRAVNDLEDSINVGSGIVKSGLVFLIGANGDTEAEHSAEDINSITDRVQIISLGLGGALDSSLVDVEDHVGFMASEASDFPAQNSSINSYLDDYESSIYLFSYASEKEGETEVSVLLNSIRPGGAVDLAFNFTPFLFFNPDTFEVKTDRLRNVSNGVFRNGTVLMRKDLRNDSVDFQLFSGLEKDAYQFLFVNRDPATFNSWLSLREDPDVITYSFEESEYEFDEGFQSEYLDPETFERKYMVLRPDSDKKDVRYIQLNLQD